MIHVMVSQKSLVISVRGRIWSLSDTGKPSARQIYGFTASCIEAVALPDRRRPPRHKAVSERFGYLFGLQALVRLYKI
jgi:hypothetical protein